MGWDWSFLWTVCYQMVTDWSYLYSVGIKWTVIGLSSRVYAVRQFIIAPSSGVFEVRNVTTAPCSERTAFCFSHSLFVCCVYVHETALSLSLPLSIKSCANTALAETCPKQLAITFTHLHLSLTLAFPSTSITLATLFSHKQSC